MNCKPGDLAVLIGGCAYGPNYGRIVTVLRIADAKDAENLPLADKRGVLWVVDKHLTWANAAGELRMRPLAYDARLRPIRDSDGEDETLTWAGLPAPLKTNETEAA